MNDLRKEVEARLQKELGGKIEEFNQQIPRSREFKDFRKENIPKVMGYYEKFANWSGRVLKVKTDRDISKEISLCHLDVTAQGVEAAAILGPLIYISTFVILTILFGILFGGISLFIVFFFVITGAMLYLPLKNYPTYLASVWRIKASNEMVLSVFYIVSYMRHTSNLELAIRFAADHLSPPMSVDFTKVLWDIESEKYESIKESLDVYLSTWRESNQEYISAMNLIQSSLYETSEDRRVELLDKSLEVILDGTYEKMMTYAHDLNSPIEMLNMLGIILPILGLVILPIVVSFMEGVRWYHLALLYDIFLPIVVFYLGRKILSSRPTGYGDVNVSEDNPEFAENKNTLFTLGGVRVKMNPLYLCIFIFAVFFLIGISPVVLHGLGFADFGFGPAEEFSSCGARYCLSGYKESVTQFDSSGNRLIVGPFGLGAAILSIMVTLGLGLSIGLYYRLKSKNVIEIRNKSRELEAEFASALFQLGNRIGDGIPPEQAFGRVAGVITGTVSGKFFEAVSNNITRLGMGLEQAIFDSKKGALVYFPSTLIDSSMKVLIQSAKKGPKVAASALINISNYVKQMHRVDERLKDLLSETISSMKSQIKFLTPVIAGIVVGITSMISLIIVKLGSQIKTIAERSATGGGAPTDLTQLFGDGIPSFYFQIIVGIYVVQIIYILTTLVNGIENGADTIGERYSLGRNLVMSTLSYCFVALLITIGFNVIAASIIGKI